MRATLHIHVPVISILVVRMAQVSQTLRTFLSCSLNVYHIQSYMQVHNNGKSFVILASAAGVLYYAVNLHLLYYDGHQFFISSSTLGRLPIAERS